MVDLRTASWAALLAVIARAALWHGLAWYRGGNRTSWVRWRWPAFECTCLAASWSRRTDALERTMRGSLGGPTGSSSSSSRARGIGFFMARGASGADTGRLFWDSDPALHRR